MENMIGGHENCLCLCQCTGCCAIRDFMRTCLCTACQLFRIMPAPGENAGHRCIMDCFNCPCRTCEAMKRETRECDCLACLILEGPPA